MVERRGAGVNVPSQVCPLGGTGHHSELVVVQVDPETFFVVKRVPKGVLEEQRAAATKNSKVQKKGENKRASAGSILCAAAGRVVRR